MGNNVCLCPSGFYGDSCQITSKFSEPCFKVFPGINSMSFYILTFHGAAQFNLSLMSSTVCFASFIQPKSLNIL